jgi:Na+-driven multidrug efflux pump
MPSSNLLKDNLALAFPILFSSLVVIGSAMINAKIVAYSSYEAWYLLGLFLPLGYLALGLLEAGRVCAIRTINSSSTFSFSLKRLRTLNAVFILPFVLLAVFLFLAGKMGFNVFNVHADLVAQFYNFSASYLLAYLFVSCNSVFNAALFGLGKAKLASLLIISISLLSIALTFLLTRFAHLGLFSIVLATAGAYLIGSIVAYFVLRSSKEKSSYLQTRSTWRYCFNLLGATGLPVFLGYLALPIALCLVNWILTYFGVTAVAAFGIVFRVQSFFILPAVALGVATGILINQKRFANKQQAKNFIYKNVSLALFFFIPLVLLLFFFRKDIASFFSLQVALRNLVSLYLAYLSGAYIFFCPLLVLLIAWEQTGSAFKSLLINLSILVLQIAVAGSIAVTEHSLILFFQLSAAVTGLASGYVLFSYFLFQRVLVKKRYCHD